MAMTRSFPRAVAVAMASILLLSASQAYAQRKSDAPAGGASKNNPKILELFKSVVAKPSQGTVSVRLDGKQVALGTVIDANGFILTKESELRGDKIVVRFKDGKELPAKKIAGNEPWDLAVLKVDAKELTPVSWSFSRVAPVGNWVATSSTDDKPVAVGVVSVAARAMPPSPKISLPTNPANRGYLGIQMEDAEGGGVRLVVVTPDAPAVKAGLKVDDVILSIDDKETPDRETLGAMVGLHKPGEKIKIRFRRGGNEEEVEVTLGKRPASFPQDRGDIQNSMDTDRSQRRTGFPVTLQHDTVLNANECGGPLVDLEGRVIGINIARGGRTDTYAIPAEAILPLLPDLMAGKSTVASRIPTGLADRIKAAEAALKEAEAAKTAADKKVAEAKSALDKLLAEQKKENEAKKEPEKKKEPDKK
jgi:serine protease Do